MDYSVLRPKKKPAEKSPEKKPEDPPPSQGVAEPSGQDQSQGQFICDHHGQLSKPGPILRNRRLNHMEPPHQSYNSMLNDYGDHDPYAHDYYPVHHRPPPPPPYHQMRPLPPPPPPYHHQMRPPPTPPCNHQMRLPPPPYGQMQPLPPRPYSEMGPFPPPTRSPHGPMRGNYFEKPLYDKPLVDPRYYYGDMFSNENPNGCLTM